jgi:transposase-like protein
MTNDEGLKPEEAPERSPKAGAGAPSGVDGNGPKRFSVQRKMAIVARLLRGEPLDLVARQMNVSVARLTEGRDRALAGAATALKERERDDRDDEIARLKSKVGEITMENELLDAKIAALEGKRPSARGRRHSMSTASSGQQMMLPVWVGAYSCDCLLAILHGSLLGSGG